MGHLLPRQTALTLSQIDDTGVGEHIYAYMLRDGKGGDQDLLGAREWYKKAADKGEKWSMYNYAILVLAEDASSSEAMSYLSKGKEFMTVVSFLESAFKQSPLASSYYNALVSELTMPEIDQLLACDILPNHKAWLQKQKEDRQGALVAQAASAAPVSVFANVPAITDLITNARKLVSESYVDTNNKSSLINKALDILRGIDKSNLEGNLIGEYSMLIDTIKAINPPYSPANAMFIAPPVQRDASGKALAKRIKTEPS